VDTRDSPTTRGARVGPFDTVRTLVEEAHVDVSHGSDVDRTLSGLDEQVEAKFRESAEST
jgi:sn-glycerol 3-phosphate transport system substrate-binding protein